MTKTFIVNGEPVGIDNLSFARGEVAFTLNGRPYVFKGKVERDGRLILQHDGKNRHGYVGGKNLKGTHTVILDNGLEATVNLPQSGRKQGGAVDRQEAHTAPMPGLVQRIHVSVGDTVASGDKLVVIEAMKLQLAIEAAYAGTIRKICCAIGGLVAQGDLLVEIEQTENA